MAPPVDVPRADWRRIKAIASAALDVAPDSRREYIASACGGGDERIEHEVTSLVAAAVEAAGLLESLPVVGWLPSISTDIRLRSSSTYMAQLQRWLHTRHRHVTTAAAVAAD